MFDDEENKEDGSVWTSYSDLFTTVAVIFLVMFVFALIKAGVSKMEAVVEKRKHESELKGKITKEVQKKTQKNISKVDDSLKDIEEYENIIDNKMKEMNSFVKNLQKNKKVMKDLIRDQTRKEAQLKTVATKLSDIESEYKKSSAKNKQISSELKDKTNKLSQLDVLQEQLTKQLEELKQKNQEASNIIKAEASKRRTLEEELLKAKQSITTEITLKEEKEKSIQKLDEKLKSTKKDLAQTFENLKLERKDKHNFKAKFERNIVETADIKIQYESKLQELQKIVETKTTVIEKSIEENKSQTKIIEEKEKVLSQKSMRIIDYEKKLDDTTKKLAQESNLKQEFVEKSKVLENEKRNEEKRVKALTSSFDKKLQESKTLLAQVEVLNQEKQQLRDSIAKLQNNNMVKKRELATATEQKSSLQKMLDSQSAKNSSLIGKNKTLSQMNSEMSKELSQKSLSLKSSNQRGISLSQANEDLKSRNNELQQSNQSLSKKVLGVRSQLGEIKSLRSKVSSLESKNFEISEKLGAKLSSAGQNINRLTEQLKAKANSETIASNKARLCQKNKLVAQQRIAFLEDKQKTLGSQTKGEQLKNKKALEDLAKSNKQLLGSNQDLKESLNNFAEKVAGVKGKLRTNIANDLASEFKKANIDVFVDNKTGNVVLLMNKNFRFKKNSFQLNRAARNTLKSIVPIYSKVLFGNKKIQDKIQGFNIIGHASPSYKGSFVKPLADNNAAYSYNMRLSAQRAASITNFIFGKRIGEYSFKRKLKSFTKAIGQGFTKPIAKTQIKMNRSLASKDNNCGPYSCHASQRVELSFTLKDDVKSLNKLIDMAKEVQE